MERHIEKKNKKGPMIALIVIGCIVCIGLFKVWSERAYNEETYLTMDREILSFDPLKNIVIETLGNQIVKITQDGIISYNIKGEELWQDTLSLDSIITKQRGQYLGVKSKKGRQIFLFNEKGKQGEIVTDYPILSFSISDGGGVTVIEAIEEGHRVSVYTYEGHLKGRESITHSKDAGFPLDAEVSPNGELLLISYINMKSPQIQSHIMAIPMGKTEEETLYQVEYGVQEKNNLAFELEFINEDMWASIGDRYTTFYTLHGKKIISHNDLYPTYTPYLEALPKVKGYLPVVRGEVAQGSSIHNKESVLFFNEEGEVVTEHALEKNATYYYAHPKGVIIGQGRQFIGYNKMGVKKFTYEATADVKEVCYVGQEIVAITKDKVFLLKKESQKGE